MELEPGERRVVLVDGEDNALGIDSVLASHVGAGRKHRAFTAVLLSSSGDVVLARRAPEKLLWPGFWDATVASHPQPDREYGVEGERRVREELGVTCELTTCGRFDYDLSFLDVGTESEVCCTLIGQLASGTELQPVPVEVSEVRSLPLAALLAEVRDDPGPFCPWMFLALLDIARNRTRLSDDIARHLDGLFDANGATILRAAIAAHFPEGTWRMLDDATGC